MNNTRTSNSIKNYLFATAGQLINLICKFLVRTVFIITLGKEYLGLSGLFGSILQVLNLAELGVGVAITYSLYKPIAENNEEEIVKVMSLFKKMYVYIGLFIIVAGCSLTPFLSFFIKDIPNIPHIKLIYLLYVLDTGVSYFYSYKGIFITAKQYNYIVTNNIYICKFICSIVQVIVLMIAKNYILFTAVMLFFTFVTNYRISVIADRLFPFLKKKPSESLDDESKTIIKNNVFSTFLHKIGGVVVYSTDSLLLSKFFGLVVVGLYSNYQLIINSLFTIVNQFFASVIASVGNLKVTENKDRQYEVYRTIYLIDFWMYSFCGIALICLFQPFIRIWLGDGFELSFECVTFITLNFYLSGMREGNITFLNAYGLVPKYKYMPIFESIINLVSSIILAKIFGVLGVFIGTTISSVLTGFWVEPYVLFKYGFERTQLDYYKTFIKYLCIAVISLTTTLLITYNLSSTTIIHFFFKAVMIALISNAVFLLFFYKEKEFRRVLMFFNKSSKLNN